MSRPFPFNPSRPLIVVDAELISADSSFRHNMTLALDTGASRTMISWPIASVVRHKSLYFDCHSERSEESRLFKYMRPFTSFRVTRKNLFQHPANVKKRWTHYTSRLGYKPEFSPLVERTKIVTGSGIEYVPEITTTEIRCLGKALRRLPVLVHDLPAEIRVDGLLGLDFLRRFRLNVDFKKGLISLR